MIVLYIFLALLLLLFTVAMIPGYITITYKDELKAVASILWLKKEIDLTKPSDLNLTEIVLSELRTRKERGQQKKRVAEAKQAPQAEVKPQKKPEPAQNNEESLLESLQLVLEVLPIFIPHLVKRLKIKTTKIIIAVGSDDAAKTAMLYAGVNNLVIAIVAFLDNYRKLKNLKKSNIVVSADFVSEKCSADIEISFSLRVWQIIEVLFASAIKYEKQYME